MSKHMSLPADLVSEWLDPRKPEDVPRREKVKWKIEVEMTKECRIAQWRRMQPGYKARVKKAKIANSLPIATPAPTVQSVVQPTAQPEPVKGLLLAAQSTNLLGGRVGTDNYMVLCPWRKEHKSGRQIHGQHDQSTQINVAEGKFHCQHGPCFTRTAEDFLKEIYLQLGVSVSVETADIVKKSHIYVIQDVSGSMNSIAHEACSALNRILSTIYKDVQKLPSAKLTLIEFATTVRSKKEVDARSEQLSKSQLLCDGGTSLNDAVGDAIIEANQCDKKTVDTSFLFVVITDGEENRSHRTNDALRQLIVNSIATDRYTFAFLCPPANVKAILSNYRIPAGCVKGWDATDVGVKAMEQATSQGITEFTTARAAGKTKVEKFFIDARKLDGSLKDLVDVTAACKVLHVDREAILQPFVEENKLPFIVGANYYSLTKPETLRPNRAILVRQKGDKQVYSGPNVRKVLGLPNDKECKVEPGDMGTYELFLESTSHNRVLVRGTDLIVRLDHQGSEHTWAVPQPATGTPVSSGSVKN